MLDMLPSLDTLQAFALLILGFGFVIFVHELGHFLVAKAVGIKVTQFALGFGTAALAWRKGLGLRLARSTERDYKSRLIEHLQRTGAAGGTPSAESKENTAAEPAFTPAQLDAATRELGLGETEYRLNWFPLGGYVKMLGQEDMDPNALSDDARAFNRKPIWARTLVISAGVTMNLIFALVFFIIAFMAGLALPPALVGGTVEGSPAATAFARGHEGQKEHQGLKPQDFVAAIGGTPTLDFTDLLVAGALGKAEQPVRLLIDRPGVGNLEFDITPIKDKNSGLLVMGIEPPLTTTLEQPAKWKKMKANWPKELTGWPRELKDAAVAPGMTVTAVNGQPIAYFSQFDDAVKNARGRPVKVTFTDKESGKTADIDLQADALGYLPEGAHVSHLLGFVSATMVGSIGTPTVPAAKTPAFEAGLQPGDIIAEVNAVAYPTAFIEPTIQDIIHNSTTQPIHVTVLRGDKTVALKPVQARNGQLMFTIRWSQPVIARVLPDAPPAIRQRNIPAGSRIVAVNGQSVATMADVQRLLQEAVQAGESGTAGGAGAAAGSGSAAGSGGSVISGGSGAGGGGPIDLEIALLLPDQPHIHLAVAQTPEVVKQIASAKWSLPMGIISPLMFTPLRQPLSARTPLAAANLGIKKTQQFMLQTYVTLLRLTQRSVPLDQLHGPLGIADVGTRITRELGWTYLLYFLGIISVNLVVINFLPIPVVDGGHILFLAIEKIRGSPVPTKIQAAATYSGLALILGLFLMVTYFDIARWF